MTAPATPAVHATKETMSSSLFKSLSISARLGLGFGCLLVLLVAMATVGQLSLNQVNTRMQEMTGAGATKTKLVNSMLESVGSLGIQSRSSAMLNEIDPKQAQEQIQAVRKTLQEYAKQEAQLAQLITPATASAAETALLQQVQAAAQKAKPEIESAMQAADDGDTVTASLNLMTRAAPAESICGSSWAS